MTPKPQPDLLRTVPSTGIGAPFLEVVALDQRDIEAAFKGGADRCELVVGLETGGLTPALELVSSCCSMGLPLRIMLRRRPDFTLPPAEIPEMLELAHAIVSLGAAGLVMGFLRPDGSLDVPAMATIAQAISPTPWSLHRAFDEAGRGTLPTVQGMDAVLTAGGNGSVADNWESLLASKPQANGLEMLAGKVRVHQLAGLFRAGYSAFHVGDAVRNGWNSPVESDRVAEFRMTLDQLSS